MNNPAATLAQSGASSSGLLIPLEQADDARLCGGKASTLARLSRLGLPVPPGFVVPDGSFREFLNGHQLQQPIADVCRGINVTNPESLHLAANTIRTLVLHAGLTEPMRGALTTPCNNLLADGPVIVRSSAVGEDGADASYAGQLDSFPNLYSVEEIEQAILCCWASYWSDRSLFYQKTRGLTLQGMGVLVQAQIASAVSGVLFTRSPEAAGEKEDQMLAEFCLGHGGLLSSGEVNPGRLAISREDNRSQVMAQPEQEHAEIYGQFLNEANRAAIGRIGVLLENTLGAPQDIEWTIDKHGKLFVVQSRPISVPDGRLSPRPHVVWSNANINENFPEPVSPLLYSIAKEGYSHYFRNLGSAYGVAQWRLNRMEHFFRNIIGIHGGRMYYNLTNIHSVLHVMPYGGVLAEFFNQFVGVTTHPSVEEPGRSQRVPEQGRLVALLEVCRIALQTLWQYVFFTKRVESLEHIVTQFSERTAPAALARRILSELHRDFQAFLDIRFHRWTNAALADAASMVCYGLLKRVLSRAFPAANQAALHNTLLKGLPNLVSSVPAVKLWELSRVIKSNPELMRLFVEEKSEEILARLLTQQRFAFFKSQFDTFLHEWGFRFSGELMLTVPNFQERPTALLEILQTYVGLEGESPLAILERQNVDRNRETLRVLRDAPWIKVAGIPVLPQAWLINRLLMWTQHAITLRERARLKQALLYSCARHIVLAIGDKLVARGDLAHCDDVFLLTYQELDTLLSGSAMFPYWNTDLVAARQSWFQELRAMTVPDTFELPDGEYLSHTGHGGPSNVHNTTGDDLRGIGVCGGRVTACATVLADLSEAARLSAGDVLVTKQTDPGWGLVFFLIKGLVMERGGMLSHGAIIAREYGIPTVVGVRDATRSIPSGVRVMVDGDQGLVRIME